MYEKEEKCGTPKKRSAPFFQLASYLGAPSKFIFDFFCVVLCELSFPKFLNILGVMYD